MGGRRFIFCNKNPFYNPFLCGPKFSAAPATGAAAWDETDLFPWKMFHPKTEPVYWCRSRTTMNASSAISMVSAMSASVRAAFMKWLWWQVKNTPRFTHSAIHS